MSCAGTDFDWHIIRRVFRLPDHPSEPWGVAVDDLRLITIAGLTIGSLWSETVELAPARCSETVSIGP